MDHTDDLSAGGCISSPAVALRWPRRPSSLEAGSYDLCNGRTYVMVSSEGGGLYALASEQKWMLHGIPDGVWNQRLGVGQGDCCQILLSCHFPPAGPHSDLFSKEKSLVLCEEQERGAVEIHHAWEPSRGEDESKGEKERTNLVDDGSVKVERESDWALGVCSKWEKESPRNWLEPVKPQISISTSLSLGHLMYIGSYFMRLCRESNDIMRIK